MSNKWSFGILRFFLSRLLLYQIEIVAHQVKGQISFSDGVEAPGGSSREVKDFRDRAVDKLEEVVLVAGY